MTGCGAIKLFFAWASRRPRLGAIAATAALFAGSACFIYGVTSPVGAAVVYLAAIVPACAVMVPWFLADTRPGDQPDRVVFLPDDRSRRARTRPSARKDIKRYRDQLQKTGWGTEYEERCDRCVHMAKTRNYILGHHHRYNEE